MRSNAPPLRVRLSLALVAFLALALSPAPSPAQKAEPPAPGFQQQQPLPQQPPQSGLTFWKDLSSIFQSVVTVVAILGGAFLYLKRRQRFPRAKITLQVTDRLISGNKVVLRVGITVGNQGEVLLSLESGFVGVQQVVPCPRSLLDSVNSSGSIVAETKTEAAWDVIAHRDFSEGRQIEPGEEEELYFDFLLDAEIKTVIVYSYFRNKVIKRKELGWNKTVIYDLSVNRQPGTSSQVIGGKGDESVTAQVDTRQSR